MSTLKGNTQNKQKPLTNYKSFGSLELVDKDLFYLCFNRRDN